MPDAPAITPPLPTIRFPLRRLLLMMAILAVVAAPAGWYFRQQSKVAQWHLAIMWSSMAFFLPLTLVYRIGRLKHIRRKAGQCRVFVSTAWSGPWRPLIFLLFSALVPAVWSDAIVTQSQTSSPSIAMAIWIGAVMGAITASMWQSLVGWPVPLCEYGVIENGKFRPWKAFARSEWIPDRPGIIRLRRRELNYFFEGDLFLRVPPGQQGVVATMLSELEACRFQMSVVSV